MSTALTLHESQATPIALSMGGIQSIQTTIEQLKAIRTFVNEELVPNVDFGIIPGTGNKNVLLQPGAQKVAMFYNTYPEFDVNRIEMGEGHMEALVTTRLVSRTSREVVAMGMGSCSTMESKYRFRSASRVCPKCGSDAIIKGKAEYGGGFICFAKKGGCGAKFANNDQAITSQSTGRAPNPDIYDQRNTVLKMGMKRSMVSAAISLGCMSELFTQDIDDVYDMTAVQAVVQEEPTKPSSTKEAQRFEDRVNVYCRTVNAKWADKHMEPDGEIPAWVKELVSPYQIVNHMLKKAGVTLPEGGKFNERMRAASAIWLQDESGTLAEWKEYVGSLAAKAISDHAIAIPANDAVPSRQHPGDDESSPLTSPVREPGSDDDLGD